jgi:hypothetical protein
LVSRFVAVEGYGTARVCLSDDMAHDSQHSNAVTNSCLNANALSHPDLVANLDRAASHQSFSFLAIAALVRAFRPHARVRDEGEFDPVVVLLLVVARRKRVSPWRHGIRVADPAVAAVDGEFSPTGVAESFARTICGFSLGVVEGASAIGARTMNGPAAITIRGHVTSVRP